MDEERSDKYIVTSTWTRRQYKYMDEEHSDEYMYDTDMDNQIGAL
jgi:hypothetical protein